MKSVLQDIIPSEKRSIRDIPISHKNSTVIGVEEKTITTRPRKKLTKETVFQDQNTYSTEDLEDKKYNKRKTNKMVWLVALFSIVCLAGIVVWFFSKTNITIDLKNEILSLENEIYFAENNPQIDATLRYNTIELSDEISKNVQATGQKEVFLKARGVVILFNNFSTASQQLIANTRLEDSTGRVYRLDKPVVIPGKKVVSGKVIPGSVEVSVTADKAGEDSNIDLSDFTIPGFKGTPKFNGFYGRSKTLITGGKLGSIPVVDQAVLLENENIMKKEIESIMRDKIKAELPKQFTLIDGGHQIMFDSPEINMNETGGAKITLKAHMKAYSFKTLDLITILAKDTDTKLENGFDVDTDFSSFNILSIKEDGTKTAFEFDGVIRFSYVLDEDALKKALAGQKKKEVPKILTQFPIIEKAQVIVSPFWVSSVTSNQKKIYITKNILAQ